MKTHPHSPALHSLLAREQRAPRYTSYPTAMEFTGGFGTPQYEQAVARTNDEPVPAPLSLYLHIPFCAAACFYCGCNRVISRSPEKHAHYLDCLLREIELQGQLFAKDRPVRQIHFGGGTPNLLRPRQLGRILTALIENFSLAEDCEISLEVDPRQARPRDATAWALLGFNRISIGVQDVDPRVQELINRRQSTVGIAALLREARRGGIESINFDLIYGLPGQTPDSFEATLEFVQELRPDRLAVFHYAHMPARFPAQRAIEEAELPSLVSAFEMQSRTRQRLLESGYEHIGMDHYALPTDSLAIARRDGRLRRNFQGYTVLGDCDLIGLGVSAISQVGDSLAQNISQLEAYEKRLDSGELAIQRGLNRSAEDRIRAALIEQIMCQGRLDIPRFEVDHGLNFAASFADGLKKLNRLDPDSEWVQVTPESLQVTEQGQDILRLIAQCFDGYADQRAERATKPVLDLRELHVPRGDQAG